RARARPYEARARLQQAAPSTTGLPVPAREHGRGCRRCRPGRARSRLPATTRSAPAQEAGVARSGRPIACRLFSLWREPLDVAEQALELAVLQPALDLGGRAHAHAPELDEARGGRLVEGIAFAVSRERVLIQLGWTLAPHHLR